MTSRSTTRSRKNPALRAFWRICYRQDLFLRQIFFRYVFSDLRPMGGVGYPAGVAIVDACAGGCVLGSEIKLERPGEHMPPRLRRKLPSIKNFKKFAEGRDQRSESYVFYSSTCNIYSSSCDGATHALSTFLRTASTAAAQRAMYTYVVYSRTCDMYSSSSSCD